MFKMKKIIHAAVLVFSLSASILSAESANTVNSVTAKPAPSTDSSQQIADMIVNSKIPVLVDFWAAWCGPCKMLNPIIKQLEKDYDKKVLFLKVNVDIHRSIAAYFNITSIPAVFIIKDKTVVKMLPGLQPREVYVNALNEILASKPILEKPITK